MSKGKDKDKTDLAVRMKDYESRDRSFLQRRMPVILRCDMKAGHTFTRKFQRPFDMVFMRSMQEAAKYMCENIMGCRLAYTQSDEISLLLVDYGRLNSSAWFDYRTDKICSVAASMATMAFNKFFCENVNMIQTYLHYGEEFDYESLEKIYGITRNELEADGEFWDRLDKYQKVMGTAMFDCRCFNLPREEVTNYFYWRQLDASRNSVQMVGRANFSHRELQNKSNSQVQDMLVNKGINWNDFPTEQKRGSCCIKEEYWTEGSGDCAKLPEGGSNPFDGDEIKEGVRRSRWIIDREIPIFKGSGRRYVEDYVYEVVGESWDRYKRIGDGKPDLMRTYLELSFGTL